MQLTIRNLSLLALALLLAFGMTFSASTVFAQTDDSDTTEESSDDTTSTTDDDTTDDSSDDDSSDSSDDDSVDTDRIAAMLAQIQQLTQLIAQLQEQITNSSQELRDLRAEIRTEIREGMTSEEIRRIQEILASDPTIYPEGITSGYFGPLTKQALRRFQAKFDLEVSGEVDEETEVALETLLEERFGEGSVPPGLLRAPGIMKKFELRLKEGCNNSGPGKAPFCKKVKIKYDLDELEVEVEEEHEHEDEDEEEEEEEEDSEAAEAIDDASDAIEDAEGEIEDAEGDLSGVEALLQDAKDLLVEAETALEDEDYETAEEKADEAEELAEDIVDVLDGDDDDLIVEITATIGNAGTEVETETNDGDVDTFSVEETDEDQIVDAINDETGLPHSYIETIVDFD